ncbi:MAG: hypothetical protein KJZ85_14575 [Rhodobacteraceae bacterium]|jgi:hypothetical protein|nr:hypothetical protein [Paracoccaceae bacterium]
MPLATLAAVAVLALPADMAAAGVPVSPGLAVKELGAPVRPAAWRDRDGTPPGNGDGPGIVPGPAPLVGPEPATGSAGRSRSGAVDDTGDLNAAPGPNGGGGRRGAVAPGGGVTGGINGGINGGDMPEAGHRTDGAAGLPGALGGACVPLARARQPACR